MDYGLLISLAVVLFVLSVAVWVEDPFDIF